MTMYLEGYVTSLEDEIDSLECKLEQKENEYLEILESYNGMVNKLNFYAELFIELEERYNKLIEEIDNED